MEQMRAWAWVLPVLLIAVADWMLRLDQIVTWGVADIAVYAFSCLLALVWVRLTGRIAIGVYRRTAIGFWACLVLLSLWSAVILLVHISYYHQFDTQVSAVAFSGFLLHLRESSQALTALLTPGHQLLALLLTVLLLPLWRVSIGEIPRRPRQYRGYLLPLVFVVLLSPLFLTTVTLSRGNFLPSVNAVLSLTHAAVFPAGGNGTQGAAPRFPGAQAVRAIRL